MGVFTKPVGGAAELVSQTGLGILQGVGLGSFPAPRGGSRSPVRSAADFENARLKFSQ
jgi:hypothetical protein